MLSGLHSADVSLAAFVQANPTSHRAGEARSAHEAHAEPEKAQTEGGEPAAAAGRLSREEERVVAELARTDREVRAHENAHLAAAGGLARGVSFEYATGPDGKQYAVAGEVGIDTSAVSGDPERTIQKAQQIRAAANAPANPSGQDRAVAAQAAQLEQSARAELAEKQRAEQTQAFEANQSDQSSDEGAGQTFQALLNEIA